MQLAHLKDLFLARWYLLDLMHVLLILPQSHLMPIVPTGILYLAHALLEAGFEVTVRDGPVEAIKSEFDAGRRPDTVAVGISTLSGAMLGAALSIAAHIRARAPGLPLIWGGAHPTAVPEQTLAHPLVDYVAVGEAEVSLIRLLEAILSGSGFDRIAGIGYREAGRSVVNPNAPYTALDRVFRLPYHLLRMDDYARKLRVGGKRWFSVLASRGCPYRCKFCSNSSTIWPNTKVRHNSLEHVERDIETLIDQYGCDGIAFNDEVFFVGEARLKRFLAFLRERAYPVRYRAAARADTLATLSPGTWDMLREVGFIGIGMGVESGSRRTLEIMGKGITVEQVRKATLEMSRVGIHKSFTIMTCVPGETMEDIRDTLRLIVWLARHCTDSPLPFGQELNKYIPLPGTALYETAIKDYGFRPPDHLEGWVDLDFSAFRDKSRRIRPWLTEDMLDYVDLANILMDRMNRAFSGRDADPVEMERAVADIEAFIASGRMPAHVAVPGHDR